MSFHESIRGRLAGVVFQGRAVPTFLGDPPDAVSPPYLFVWARLPVAASTDVGSCTNEIDETVSVTVVAQTPGNTLALASLVAAALNRWKPTAEGWDSSPLRHTGATDIQTDRGHVIEGTNRHPAWCVLRFRLNATKRQETP